jgi:Spy/CpxP family protein refolding chaperone
MPRTIALLFASTLMFTATACDPTEEPVEDRAAEVPEAEPGEVGAKRDHHGKHGKHGKHNPADKLCAEIECSEAQAAQIDELFASRHERRDGAAHEARKAARAEAHQAIADAFRADTFDVAVLDRVAPEGEHDGEDREAKLIAFATELHALLTPEQRAKLADEIEAGHPMLFHHGKRGGHHGKWGKHFAEKHGGDHLAHAVDRFCEPITCTAEQETQLTAIFQSAHEAKRDARAEHEGEQRDLKPLADAFRAETLDEGQLRAALAEGKGQKQDRKADHREAMGATLAEIHQLLTPEQRAIVADVIEADGLHALIGKRKGEGKGKRHGKKGKRGRGGPEAVDAE